MKTGGVKGTVTSMSSLFPAEDTHKAATRVQDAISEKQRELQHLRGFISDNANLINLVQKLPEELYHEVMVPFGKAAFFPGRLIHTNEFLVLLGEGYYAERTSKQTVDILKRRGKALNSQVDSLKAMMDNLRAQASFFDATTSEATEGLVEIKEEYVEESSSDQEFQSGVNKQDVPSVPGVDKAKTAEEDEEYARIMSGLDELEKEEKLASVPGVDKAKIAEEDEEYARIMSRLDELEKEEELAGVDKAKIAEEDEEYARIMSRLDELEKEEELVAANDNASDEEDEEEKETSNLSLEKFHDDKLNYSKASTSAWLREEHISSKDLLNKYQQQQETSTNLSKCLRLSEQSSSKEHMSRNNNSLTQTQRLRNPNSAAKSVTFAEVKEKNQTLPSSTTEAFTGSIIERPPIIPKTSKQETEAPLQPSGSQPLKPVSRFKMQRR